MPRARNMDIDVVITTNPAGGYDFALDPDGGGKTQQVNFNNQNRPGFMIYFNIDDQANSGYEFQPVPSNALWVNYAAQGDPNPPACPLQAATWNRFVPLSVEKDGSEKRTQLIVYYRNSAPQQLFRFALRFVDANGNDVPDYDPIGNGNNGPRS